MHMVAQRAVQVGQKLRAILGSGLHQLLLFDDIDCCQRHGTGDRVAAVGVAVHPGVRAGSVKHVGNVVG